MKLLGLTGGIGTGKSTAAQILQRCGIPVVDTDDVAREVVEPGQPSLDEIARAFGSEVLDSEGRLRRDVLAEVVFASPEKRVELEAILHPRIRANWMRVAEDWRKSGQPLGVVVIPLLFETGAQSAFDQILCTACSQETQRQRLRARTWTDTQIQQRLSAQWPLEKKMAASHRVLWTEGEMFIHQRQIELVLSAFSAA